MDQITINPLQANQIDELIAVAHHIWHAHYPGIITLEQIDYMLECSYTRAVIQEEYSQQGITWLTINDGATMIGFVSFGPYGTGTIKLHKLYLLPEYHGKAIGKMALGRFEQYASEAHARTVTLNVNKHNHKAIRAYEQSGWYIADEVINDIGNGFVMDDFIFVKQIQS